MKKLVLVHTLAVSLAMMSGCVEPDDAARDEAPTQAPSQALSPAASQNTLATTPKEISRGSTRDILSAIEAHDIASLNRQLPDLYQVNAVVQVVTQGPMIEKAGLTSAVYFRHASSPTLQLLVADDAPLNMQLLAIDGKLHNISFDRTQVEGGWWLISVDAAALPTQGLLLLGPTQHDLTSLDINVWAMAIMDEPKLCSAKASQCASDDLLCVIESHASCIEESLDLYDPKVQDLDAGQQIINYMEANSARFKRVEAAESADGSGGLELTWRGPGSPTQIFELFADGTQRPLPWRLVAPNHARIDALTQPIEPDSLIVLSESKGIESMGAAKAFGWLAKAGKTWTVQGCLQFRDDWLQYSQPNLPLSDVDIQVASSLSFGLYNKWSRVRTNASGCFVSARTFYGPFKGAKRKFKVRMRLADGNFTMWNIMSVDGILHGGFSEILELGLQSQGGINIGTRLFAPGQAGHFGDSTKHRQVASFDGVRRLDDALRQQNSWLGFNGPYHMNYPMSSSGVAITPPNPLNVFNPWGPAQLGHTMFLSTDYWDMPTIIHESAHAWHYKHKSGNIPNIIPGFTGPINVNTNGNPWPWNWTWNFDQWGTHNCQEDSNLAFLEGFAEYVAHEALCGAVFNSPLCGITYDNPRELDNLQNSTACIVENQPLLTNEARVVRNDDGVTHGLKLLTAQNQYRRDYINVPLSGTWNAVANVFPSINLPSSCLWGDETFDLYDVMLAFRANASAGYLTDFPISAGHGLLEFYQRFGAIYQTHPRFLAERRPYLNPQTTLNPWQQCFKRCAYPSQMANGALLSSSLGAGPNQCDVISVISSASLSTQGRRWYAQPEPVCPLGSWDGANCHVSTPAPGTSAFIWMGGLYTSALPGNVCPQGSWDGANCYLGHPPAGTTGFIWMGNLYTTALMSCPVGQLDGTGLCYIGSSPTGTQAIITGNNTLSYLE